MKRYKIMVIEDDPVIQGELQTLLNGNGYITIGVKNFSAVTEQIKDEKPHLILLDIKLPGENGFALCSKIRTFSQVPIIFVTSCNTDMDELNSIMLGGDAFITKPYNTAILLAKIASLLKKSYPVQQREQISCGNAVLHLESSKLEYGGKRVELTKNELKILYYLFKNGGKICSRADMIEYLWDNQLYVDDNAL
ncbi:MAG: response regulator transcription factor, partial [Eubacteriales bacterium]|nr:response regulator transcription factor [Eubacteriales bacterium]